MPLPEREHNFKEVESTIGQAEAMAEAARCLSCGCLDVYDCRLRSYADTYNVDIDKLPIWTKRKYPLQTEHPFITVDPNKCITCRRCVHGCSEYQIQHAFELQEVRKGSNGGPPAFTPAINERCVSCGLLSGQLSDRGPDGKDRWAARSLETGTGQNHLYLLRGGLPALSWKRSEIRIVRVTGVDQTRRPIMVICASKGRFGFDFINHPDRLKYPLIKEDGHFRQASWDEALDLVAKRFLEIRDQYGPDSLAGLSSARATNEENYLMQKMVRGVFKTNNIDHCARL